MPVVRLFERLRAPFIQESLYNHEIESFLKEYLPPNEFLGVFPINLVPWKTCLTQSKWSLVANLDPHHKAGSHFVAVARKNDYIYYFDSLALGPNTSFQNLARCLNITLRANDQAIQSIFSKFCGYYCICFVLYANVNKKIDLMAFCNNFSVNDATQTNERKCLQMITCFKKYLNKTHI